MHFIGLDLAWAAKNRTGVAVVDIEGRLQHVGTAISDDDIVRQIDPYVSDDCVVAIDAPLRVTNDSHNRPAEAQLNKDFSRYEAGARPAFRKNVHGLFDPPRGELLAARLDLDIDPNSGAARQAIEVYPHPATVSLFRLGCTLKYKTGRGGTPNEKRVHRQREMQRLAGLIEDLVIASPAMDVTGHEGWVRLRKDLGLAIKPFELDRVEDPIDAVLCAYLAMFFFHRRGEMRIYGDFPDNGYIATPQLPPGLEPDCSKPSAGSGSQLDLPSADDLANEIDHCRAQMLALQANWSSIEHHLEPRERLVAADFEVARALNDAAKRIRAANRGVAALLKHIGP